MEKAIWRIIDVNFNRAREGARVVEEFARFVLNSKVLSSKAKQLRHELSSAISKLDQSKLITSRDSQNDVGFGLEVQGQLKRKEAKDVFIAAAKRLPEALRSLTETIQTIDPETAFQIEKLRFQAYSLEKEITLAIDTSLRYSKVKLYVLLDGSLGSKLEEVAKACIDGGADCLQLRAKNLDDLTIFELAKRLVNLCKSNDVISIINDRVDIAIASDADGVHLGQDDLPVEKIREIIPKPMIIGLSTHNPDQLSKAIAQNVDYVGVGPAFQTITKPDIEIAGLSYIEKAMQMLADTGVGHAVIGGVSLENIDQLTALGVNTAAVCSAVTQADNPKEACEKLKMKL